MFDCVPKSFYNAYTTTFRSTWHGHRSVRDMEQRGMRIYDRQVRVYEGRCEEAKQGGRSNDDGGKHRERQVFFKASQADTLQRQAQGGHVDIDEIKHLEHSLYLRRHILQSYTSEMHVTT